MTPAMISLLVAPLISRDFHLAEKTEKTIRDGKQSCLQSKIFRFLRKRRLSLMKGRHIKASQQLKAMRL